MESLTVPALGRSFNLGMLYDSYQDQPIAGWSLWAKVTARTSVKSNLNCRSIVDDDIKTKCSNLGIEGDFKLGVIGKLVSPEGAGKYIYDHKMSSNQIRVILKYSLITCHEEMTMEQLTKVDYPDILDKVKATHFVAGIDHGLEAYIIFDQVLTSSESLHDGNGSLKASVEAVINSASGGIEGKRKITHNTKNITCKYYGDIKLPCLPTCYEEAIEAYKQLCECKEENSVPKVVYLRPISELSVSFRQLSYHCVCSEITIKSEEILESIHAIEVECKDLKSHEGCKIFCGIAEKIDIFMQLLHQFKTKFSCDVSKILP